jgi:hypothetical protein
MAEARTTRARLLTVREIREDVDGAVLHFQEGAHARLPLHHADYATYVRLARRSQERHHPIGVRFAEGRAVRELLRADNDVPVQLLEEGLDRGQVFFQGHDGVFHLVPDHPASGRMRALLDEAIGRKARVWFIAQKPDLALLDVVPAGWEAAAAASGCGGEKDCRVLTPEKGASSSQPQPHGAFTPPPQ